MSNLKKLGLGILGLVIVAVLYYFVVGSSQMTTQMKEQLNTELTLLQKEGFSVQNREIKDEKEHFVLSFDEPKKMSNFLTRHGLQINASDAQFLTGMKIAVDVQYKTDTYSAVSFDMYPIALPTVLLNSSSTQKDQIMLQQVQQMLKKKTFLMHVAINKLGTGYKGNMRDIEEVLHGEQDVNLSMKGFTFSGDIKDNAIKSVHQNLKTLRMKVKDEIDLTLYGMVSNYMNTGTSSYDFTTDYAIDKINIDRKDTFNFLIKKFSIKSISTQKDGLVSQVVSSKTKHANIVENGKKFSFDSLNFDININNLDAKSFEALQQVDVNNGEKINTLLQTLISKGVSIQVPDFSLGAMELEDNKLGGFKLTAEFNIDKSLDILSIQQNPMAGINAINADMNLTLSKELYTFVAMQPQAMMVIMIFQPKELNGKKVYEVKLKDGSFTVNGMSM